MKARLILENGMIFEGNAFGHLRETVGELVFSTGMAGYQEVLTDPSNYGQIVTLTYPLIGNYGINLDDMESDGPKVKGLIVREKCDTPSNWRAEMELDGYLKQNRILGLEGIDTRALTKIIRNNGTMKGIIAVRDLSPSQIEYKFNSFNNSYAVNQVTPKEVYEVAGTGKHIAIIDYGIKRSIIKSFKKRDCRITLFPANTSAKDILAINPDGIFLSNGPGDPKDLNIEIESIKGLIGKKPIFGIGLGHQILALSMGGETRKLKFGHRGNSHPVKDLSSNQVIITSQNHGYVVVEENLPDELELTHININDLTVEGMKHKTLPIFSVQFHPEDYLFDSFMLMIGGELNA